MAHSPWSETAMSSTVNDRVSQLDIALTQLGRSIIDNCSPSKASTAVKSSPRSASQPSVSHFATAAASCRSSAAIVSSVVTPGFTANPTPGPHHAARRRRPTTSARNTTAPATAAPRPATSTRSSAYVRTRCTGPGWNRHAHVAILGLDHGRRPAIDNGAPPRGPVPAHERLTRSAEAVRSDHLVLDGQPCRRSAVEGDDRHRPVDEVQSVLAAEHPAERLRRGVGGELHAALDEHRADRILLQVSSLEHFVDPVRVCTWTCASDPQWSAVLRLPVDHIHSS